MYIPFNAVYVLTQKKRIFVYVLCHGVDARDRRCKNKIVFIGHYKRLTDIVNFNVVAYCDFCGYDYSELPGGGIQPGTRTAEKWIEIALKKKADYVSEDAKECLREDAAKKVHIPANKRQTHQAIKKRSEEKKWNLYKFYKEGA